MLGQPLTTNTSESRPWRFGPVLLLTPALLLGLVQFACATRGEPPSAKPDLLAQADKKAQVIEERLRAQGSQGELKASRDLENEEEQNRNRAIENYRALLADRDALDASTLESALINLGHLVFEQCLAQHRRGMQAYDEGYKEFQLGHSLSRPSPPLYDFRPARQIYEEFLQKFPDSPRRSEVLYNMAYSYEEEGDLDKAVSLFGEVALAGRETRFSPEAFMRLGEHHFELNEFDRARQYYGKVLDLGETPLYEKALFKIGWCDYAEEQTDEARKAFARLLDLYAPQGGKKRGDLYRESLEVLAKILSETGGATALEGFLREHRNPPYGLDLSVQLGDHFRETSRFKDAIETYQEILRTYGSHASAPFVEKSLIECLRVERRTSEAESLEATLANRYGRQTPWDLANPDPELRGQVDALLREILSNQIVAHHRNARERKDPNEYEKAIQLYENYLKYFPQDEKAYENRFLLAECLFETGRFERAAEEYERISKEENFLEYRERASSKRLQCLEALRSQNRVEIDSLLAAYQDYIELNPGSDQVPLLLFKQGEILFNASRHVESAALFQRIIREYPQYANAPRAWLLALESYFAAANYPELEQWAERILTRDLALDAAQRGRVEHLLQLARFELARAEEQKGNWAAAAESYRRLAEEAPGGQVAPDALFNAAVCYQKAEDIASAAACFEKIVTLYPQSKYHGDALLVPLTYYEQSEQWDRILEHLDRIYQKDPKSPLAQESLYKTARKLRSKGQDERAREVFTLYANRYPQDSAKRLEIAYLQAEMDEKRGAFQEALAGYRRFLDDYEKTRKSDPALSVDPFSLACAQFRVLEPTFQDYGGIQLREPLKQNLAKKQALLDRLVDGYMKTAQYGAGEYATASAYRVGEVYENFWKSFLESQVPGDLSQEELAVYRDLLKQQATPYLEKAVAAYRVTLEKAREKNVFNPWVLSSYSHLSALDPEHYPSLFQDSPVAWEDTWTEKRSLIRKIDQSQPRVFSAEKAKSIQSKLDQVLQTLQGSSQGQNLERSRIEQAIQVLHQLLQKEPTLFEAHFNLGVLYQMQGETGKAKLEYQTALKQNPQIPLAHLNLGIVSLQEGDAPAAEQHMRELALLSPEYAGAYYLLGVSRIRQKSYAQALDPLNKAVSLLPQFLDPYVELGEVHAKLGKTVEALASYRTVLEHPKAGSRVLRKLGCRLLEEGHLDEAIRAYSRILEGEEAQYDDWNNRGVAFLRKGSRADARADFVEAIEKGPQRPEALNNLGILYAAEKAYDKSVSCFLESDRKQPSFQPALLNAGIVYGEFLKDMEKATEFIRRYLEQGGSRQKDLLAGWIAGSQGKEGEPQS